MATLNGEVSIKFSKILQKIMIIPRVIIKHTNPHVLTWKSSDNHVIQLCKDREQVNLYAMLKETPDKSFRKTESLSFHYVQIMCKYDFSLLPVYRSASSCTKRFCFNTRFI